MSWKALSGDVVGAHLGGVRIELMIETTLPYVSGSDKGPVVVARSNRVCIEHDRPMTDCIRLAVEDFDLPQFDNCEFWDSV